VARDLATGPRVAAGDPGVAVSRRSVLRRLGAAAAGSLVVGDGLLAYRAYDQGVLAEGRGPAFDAWDTWREGHGVEALVAAAVLAPSGHNAQPWTFAAGADRIDVHADRQRSTGANDPFDRELHVSLGCALESLVLAAPTQGLLASPTVAAGPGDRVATVALRRGHRSEPALFGAIGDRRTDRTRYSPDPVPASVLAELSALADGDVAPARLRWLTSPSDRAAFAELLVSATRDHVADDEQSRDSFAWWRHDWDEIQRRKDGLTIDGVGLPLLTRTLGKLLGAPSRSAADRTFVERTQVQASSAAAFGVIVVDDPGDRRQQVLGGRLLQRLHLGATIHDVAFQPMNQITERIDRDRQLGRSSPCAEPLDALVGSGALVAFRVGRSTAAALPSPRRPAAEVLR
jgi:hypothetical protein